MRHASRLSLAALCLAAVLAALAACGGTAGNTGTDLPDASVADGDAGQSPDSGASDSGVAVPLPGFGAITGECGVLDTELTDTASHLVLNQIDFGTNPYDASDFSLLTPGGQKVMSDTNAGGSSIPSEAFAVELLARCELATLLKSEMEIGYANPAGKRTDELMEIDGLKIGVSVTRAMSFPRTSPYTVAQAQTLLEKKLQGVLDSTTNVAAADKWRKQILVVIADEQRHSDAIQSAYQAVSATLRADTVVLVTVSQGADDFLY